MRIAFPRRLSLTAAAVATAVVLSSATAHADVDGEALVNALNAIFGKNEGLRAAHTNGLCLKGAFTPSAEARTLSKAAHFSGGPKPVIARFSMGGGNPNASNTQQDNARGLALHIDTGTGGVTDMVMISAPIFAARTPEDFLTLLQTVATKDGEKIGAFFKAHPEATRQAQWLKARPVPSSYAGVSYYGVHAFGLINAAGQRHDVKLKFVPVGGETGLSNAEAKEKPADFYTAELAERLAKGPLQFTLYAVLGQPGDPLDDPTALWPEADRTSVALGVLALTANEPAASCDTGMFDPNNLADGVEAPKDDKILAMRSQAYAVSLSRRTK